MLALFLWSASSDSESGWILGVLGGVILALFLADSVVAQWSARRVRLEASVPGISWAGDTVACRFSIEGVRRPVGVRMASLRGSRPVLISAPAEGTLESPTLKRGVYPFAIFETTVFGPLGLAEVTRTDSVPLAAPIAVGPLVHRDGTGARPDRLRGRALPDPTSLAGVRPYRAGDTRRRVHCAAVGAATVRSWCVTRTGWRTKRSNWWWTWAPARAPRAWPVGPPGRALDHLAAHRPFCW